MEHDDDRLREAFAWALLEGVPTDRCPTAEEIWQAVGGGADRTSVIDHVSECPVCAEAWRLAVRATRKIEDGER